MYPEHPVGHPTPTSIQGLETMDQAVNDIVSKVRAVTKLWREGSLTIDQWNVAVIAYEHMWDALKRCRSALSTVIPEV